MEKDKERQQDLEDLAANSVGAAIGTSLMLYGGLVLSKTFQEGHMLEQFANKETISYALGIGLYGGMGLAIGQGIRFYRKYH